MSETRKDFIGLLLLIGLMASAAFGAHMWTSRAWMQGAIKAGAGRWTINAETGETRFEWIKHGRPR